MQVKFDIPGIEKAVAERVEAALETIGAAGVGWASDQLRANGSIVTGNLVNSVAFSTENMQSPVSNSTGAAIEKPEERLSVRIGSNVVYARRVELGFSGKDSLGRTFNQPPKSFLRAAITAKQAEIRAIFQKAIHG